MRSGPPPLPPSATRPLEGPLPLHLAGEEHVQDVAVPDLVEGELVGHLQVVAGPEAPLQLQQVGHVAGVGGGGPVGHGVEVAVQEAHRDRLVDAQDGAGRYRMAGRWSILPLCRWF